MTGNGQMFDPPPKFSEREWQTILQEGLKREGWAWQHIYKMKTARGNWRTSTTAVGWPDLVAMRGPYVLALEVKADRGVLGADQLTWLKRFADIPTGLVWVLRPRDNWQAVANWLHEPEKAPKRHGW